jgi:hypothetical protein
MGRQRRLSGRDISIAVVGGFAVSLVAGLLGVGGGVLLVPLLVLATLELRAAISLGSLWRRQGKIVEARHLLGEIYGWFNEGFDTADLQEARARLEELA